MTELLAGALSGGPTIQPGNPRMGGIINNMFAVLIDPARLAGVDWLRREIDGFVDYVKASPPADPAAPVLVPGDPERLARAERSRDGIEVDATTWEEILAAGESQGIDARPGDDRHVHRRRGHDQASRALVTLAALLLVAASPAIAQETPRMGGVLKVATIGEPPTLDMHTTTAVIVVRRSCGTSTRRCSPTTRASTPIPLLAESHAVSDSGLRHTITLRKGVKFHNGKEMTAADVVAVAQALGQGRVARQAALDERREHRGQGPVHGRARTQAAVGARCSSGWPSRNGAASIPKEIVDAAGDGPAEGVHRHRPLPLRRAQARPPHEAGALQGLRGAHRAAQRLRRQAHGVPRRDPVHPGARHRRAAGRRGDRRVPPRACSMKQDAYDRIKTLPAARAAHRQAARLGGRPS